MSRSLSEDARILNPVTHRQKRTVTVQTLTAAYTISEEEGDIMVLDPGGATRVVTLPVVATNEGRIIHIVNTADAAEDLTIKDVGATTIVTISQNERGIVMCAGGVWYGHTGLQT